MTKKPDNGGHPPDMELWQRVADTVDAYAPSPMISEGMSDLFDVDKRYTDQEDENPTDSEPVVPNVEVKQTKGTTSPPQKSREVDGNTARRLRRGKVPIDMTIDLHGLNQDRAHGLFNAAVSKAYGRGQRCLLVVTGKGLRSKTPGGVLKKKLPQWCDLPSVSHMILQVVPAQAMHGGGGAFYVYLRRKRG